MGERTWNLNMMLKKSNTRLQNWLALLRYSPTRSEAAAMSPTAAKRTNSRVSRSSEAEGHVGGALTSVSSTEQRLVQAHSGPFELFDALRVLERLLRQGREVCLGDVDRRLKTKKLSEKRTDCWSG